MTVTASDGDLSVSDDFTLTVEDIPVVGPTQAPFPGPDAPVLDQSLTVDATNFDSGGQGVAWNDGPGADGVGGVTRPGTDVELVGAEQDIGYIAAGDWVEYTVNVAEAGTYALSLNAKTPIAGNSIAVSLEDGPALATFELDDANGPTDNGFGGTAFSQTGAIDIDLAAGVQTLRFTFDGAPATNGFLMDFRSFDLDKVEDPVDPQPNLIGEAGTVSFAQPDSDTWFSVAFAAALDNPVVVMGPLSLNGDQPATMRVQNVTSEGFEFQLDEWDYLDGGHTGETVSWLAIESGQHVVNGLSIAAGIGEASGASSDVSFGTSFADSPVVLAQVTSTNQGAAVADRVDAVTQSGFSIALDRQQSDTTSHGIEDLSWIAVQSGGSVGDGLLVGSTGDTIGHLGGTIDFGGSFGADDFAFLADMQSEDGGDPAVTRLSSLDASFATVFIEEETSQDAETNHVTEEVGYLALLSGQIFDDIA